MKNRNVIKILVLTVIFMISVMPIATAYENTFIVETKGQYDLDKAYEVLELVNQERENVGLNPLKLDTDLTELAMQRAAEVAIYYNHLRPFYNTTVTAGGENIAVGQWSAQEVMDDWMSSIGHRRQIVPVDGYDNTACINRKTIGIACYDTGDFLSWVQIFSGSDTDNEFTTRGTLDKNVEVEVMRNRLDSTNLQNQLVLFYNSLGSGKFTLKSNDTLKLLKIKFRNLDKSWRYYSQITCKNVKFDTTDRDVCTVSTDGTITAIGPGNATITATLDTLQDSINIAVENPLKSISLPNSIDITNKTPGKLTVTYVAENPQYDTTDDKTVTWKSDDTSIAEVDQYGNVTGKRAGSTTITAKVGELTAKCRVNVSVEIESITLSTSNISTYVNKTISPLTVTYYPADSSNKGVTWSSDREDIASVDSDGTIHTKSKGRVVITATTLNGKTAQCTVDVADIRLSINTFSYQFNSLTEELALEASLSNGESTAVTWKSENENIATVDSNGNVTPIRGGYTHINATSSEYGSVSCSIYVCVSIELEDGSKAYAGDLNRDGVFSTDDTDLMSKLCLKSKPSQYDIAMADFDNDGHVTTADIAVLLNLMRYYSYKPGEYRKISNISFKEAKITVVKGAEIKVLPEIEPVDTTDSTRLTWNSSQINVASVSQDGTVKAENEGETIIKATLSDGKYAEYTLVVDNYLKGDMNKDGKINSEDAAIVIDKYKNVEATMEDIAIGDMDENGQLNSQDAAIILDMYNNIK